MPRRADRPGCRPSGYCVASSDRRILDLPSDVLTVSASGLAGPSVVGSYGSDDNIGTYSVLYDPGFADRVYTAGGG